MPARDPMTDTRPEGLTRSQMAAVRLAATKSTGMYYARGYQAASATKGRHRARELKGRAA